MAIYAGLDGEAIRDFYLNAEQAGGWAKPKESLREMLVAQAKWLPQYRTQIAPAKRRLAAHETAGTRVKLSKTTGAVRLKTKSVKEMKADSASAAANAAAADKGKMTR